MKYEETLLKGVWEWEGLNLLIDDIHGLFLEGIPAEEIARHIADSLMTSITPMASAVSEPLRSLLEDALARINYEYVAKTLVESVVQEMVSSSRDRWNNEA